MLASSVPTDSTDARNDAVFRVEQQHPEVLDRPAPELRQQELRHGRGDTSCGALAGRSRQRPASELDRRQHLRRPRRADALHLRQFLVARANQAAAPRRRPSTALARSSAVAWARPWPSTMASSSLSPSACGPEPFELFTRPIVRRNRLHDIPPSLFALPPQSCGLPCRQVDDRLSSCTSYVLRRGTARYLSYTSWSMRALAAFLVSMCLVLAACSGRRRKRSSTARRAPSTRRGPRAPSSTPRAASPPRPSALQQAQRRRRARRLPARADARARRAATGRRKPRAAPPTARRGRGAKRRPR